MVAVNCFDPRLIWDLPQQEKQGNA
jgi:uncharacterized paraquat-inducible protein A